MALASAAVPGAEIADEDVIYSYHPPHIVYFEDAAAHLRRSVLSSLRQFCLRRDASRPSAEDIGLGYETFLAFCDKTPVRVLMGVNHRRQFNLEVFICSKYALIFEEREKVEVFPAQYRETFEIGMRCIHMSRRQDGVFEFFKTGA